MDTLETTLQVRLLAPADADRARALFAAGMRSMAPLLPSDEARTALESYIGSAMQGDMADPVAYYSPGSDRSGFWVATIQGEVVGTAAAYPAPGEPGVVEVFRVSVDERHRRRGIADALMDALETWATSAGYRESMLRTTEYLKAAHALYERRGYRMVASTVYGEIKIREYRKPLG